MFIWGKADIRVKKSCLSGEFLYQIFYIALDSSAVVHPAGAQVWLGIVPPRVHAFFWLAVARKVSTTKYVRSGFDLVNILDICPLCEKEIINSII